MMSRRPNGWVGPVDVPDLRTLLAEHLPRPPASITVGQVTYDLRPAP